MTQTAPQDTLGGIARSETPVLDTVLAMNLDALDRSGLDADTYVLVRLATLVALDAPPASYAVTLAAAAESDVTLEQAQAVLVAIAPLVGSPRITAAAGNILRALVGAEALADAIPEQRTS
jgi:4-carboxymuconolactone decarboxylase